MFKKKVVLASVTALLVVFLFGGVRLWGVSSSGLADTAADSPVTEPVVTKIVGPVAAERTAADATVRVSVITGDATHQEAQVFYVDPYELERFAEADRARPFFEAWYGTPGGTPFRVFLSRESIREIWVLPPGVDGPVGL